MENEGEGPNKKNPKLLSQSEQFLASAKLPARPTVLSQSSTGSFSQVWTPANTSTTSSSVVLLPCPGYIDPKPEPGELPAEPPKEEQEHLPVSLTWCPATQPFEYPPCYTAKSSSSYNRLCSDPTGPTPYDTCKHGHQYKPSGGSWYEGPGAHAPDLYYALLPASQVEPWHMHHSGHMYPKEGGYH